MEIGAPPFCGAINLLYHNSIYYVRRDRASAMYVGGKFLTFFKGLLELVQFQKVAMAFECKMRDGNENHVSIS